MAAIDLYQAQIHQDASEAQVVLTRPTHSQKLESQLINAGWHTVSTEQTVDAFGALTQRATYRVVVMTPFLDEAGALWLRELLEPLHSDIRLILILRSLEDSDRWDYPKGFPGLQEWLVRKHVRVFNYSIPRAPPPSRETFHAKVILADRDFAYVGSANVTAASREQSMEMGVVVKGQAAAEVATIVDAVISSAVLWICEQR
jgi:phosphatidylserine/phosphatidylglycerophosphate/cardiolipin synthase-like enzyme